MKILILLSVLLVSFSCRKSTDLGDSKLEIDVPLTGGISTLDPANSYDTVSGTIVYQVYEQLFEYHYLKRPYVLQPLLAESMPEITNGGKTYTIKIKKGVKYHKNKCFDHQSELLEAEDFINQIKRLAFVKTRSPGWWLFENKIVGLDEFRKNVGSDLTKFFDHKVEGLKALDKYTLQINLIAPYPQLIYALAMAFTSPMKRAAIECTNNNFNQEMIGTGPFYLKKWNKNHSVELLKFKHYRKATFPSAGDRVAHQEKYLADAGKTIPFVNKVKFHIMKESQTRWLNFNSGKIDLLTIPKDNFSSAITPKGGLTKDLESKGIKLQISPTLIYWWLSFNMNDPLLGKNQLLRKAIAHAVDFDKFIDLFTNNVGQRANSIYPPGIPGYRPNHDLPYGYNPEKAKELLSQAGFPGGKGLPELTYDVRGNGTTHRQMGEFIKKELGNIGIQIKVVTNTFPGFLEKTRKGDLQFWQDGWALDYPDAENILQLLISKNHPPSPNTTYYSNPVFDKHFDELKFLQDGARKFELMKKMEDIIEDDLPWIMMYYARNYILHHPHLKNYRHSDLVYNYFKYLKIQGK